MFTAPRPALLLTASLALGWAWLGQPPLATAQTPLGGEFQINSYTTGDQKNPAVARNADGEFLVVWESHHPSFGVALMGQGYDAAGDPIGSEFRVEPITTFQQEPSVAADADGNFIVVFNHSTGNIGQKYDVSGTRLGAPFYMSGFSVGSYSPSGGPDVAAAADGSFVVVWEDRDYYNYGLRGRRFDSSGNPLTGEFVVNQEPFYTHLLPEVASAPNGDFAVVWWTVGGSASTRRFDASGTPVSDTFVVASSLLSSGFDTAVGEDGNVVVVWGDGASPNIPIRGRRYDTSGAPLGGEFNISTAAGRTPAIASDADGDFVVAWSESYSGPRVLARELDAGGMPQTAPFQVNTYTTSFSKYPAVASDEAGNYVVVWHAYGLDGDRFGIFGQRFAGPDLLLSVDGTCPGPVTVHVSNAPPNSEVAIVPGANTNGFVKGGTLCPGTQFEIGEPFQLPPSFVIVDGEGRGEAELGANRCFVQALALASCETSNVVLIP